MNGNGGVCNMLRACKSLQDDAVANSGTCWKEVQADFECQICFDVLVGVHVLGEPPSV